MARLTWLLIAGLAVGGVYFLQAAVPEHLRVTVAGLAGWTAVLVATFVRPNRTRGTDFAASVCAAVIAAGAVAIVGRPAPWIFWTAAAALVAVPVALGAVFERRWAWVGPVAAVAALGLVAVMLAALFPPGSWGDLVLTDDFPIVHYNTAVDLRAWAAGGAFGWDDAVSGGRTTILSLRTLAPLVFPFTAVGVSLEAALLIVYALSLLGFPLLVAAFLAAQHPDRRREAFAWGIVTGALLGIGYTGNLFTQGMMNSMASIDLTLCQLIGLDGMMRRRRGYAILLGVAGALGVWVHLAQLVFGLILLAIVAGVHLHAGRRPDLRGVLGAGLIAVGGAWPFLAALVAHRADLAVNYLESNAGVIESLRALGPLGAVEALASVVIWAFPGFIRIGLATLPLAGLAFALSRGAPSVRGVALGFAALMVSVFFSWVPSVGFAMLRLHFLVPMLVAILLGFVALRSSPLARAVLLVGVALCVLANPHLYWPLERFHAASLAASEPALVDVVRRLPGRRVLYENSAGQTPLADAGVPYDVWPGAEVQRGGVLALASGRRLFAHPGWDPYPYHRHRDAFIVNGAWQGERMDRVGADVFHAQLMRYGVGGVVVWSASARRFFGARADRYRRVGEVPARHEPYDVPMFEAFEVLGADERAARVEGDVGSASVVAEGPFHFTVDLADVPAGRWVRVVTRHLPGWRATVDGRDAEVAARDGLLAVRVAEAGASRLELRYDRRGRHLWIGVVAAMLGLVLVALTRSAASRVDAAEDEATS